MTWKRVALLSLATVLPLAQAETVLGVYIFHRHGDRTPKSHKPANLTSLGAEEVFSSGEYYRNRYVAGDATSRVLGLSSDIAVASQVDITSPSDAVLQNSAHVFAQALYPPVGTLSTEELANGSSVEAPMGGSQYLPISAVATAASSKDSENSAWLQGNSGCGKAMVSSNNYFSSADYAQTYRDSKDFYHDLLPVIQGTFAPEEANFKNGYTIFDLINVARIHNKTIPASELLTDEAMWQLTHLANVHEWNLAFNETEPIRAVSGAVLAGQVLRHLEAAMKTNSKGQAAVPLAIQFGAYASFSSFFGLAQLHKQSADFMSIVDYASSMAFELVTNATGAPAPDDVAVRFLFANGTAAERAPVPVALFGRAETLLPWPAFHAEMTKFAIADTKHWCTACGNTTGTCATFADNAGADAPGTASKPDGTSSLSPAVAGVIGALVALVVVLGVEALVYFLAGLRLVKKSTLAANVSKA
jgi:hypothetical protein